MSKDTSCVCGKDVILFEKDEIIGMKREQRKKEESRIKDLRLQELPELG